MSRVVVSFPSLQRKQTDFNTFAHFPYNNTISLLCCDFIIKHGEAQRFGRGYREVREMNEVKLTAKIDTAEIDKAIEKAVKLQELLKEANSLARELASMELKLDVKL